MALQRTENAETFPFTKTRCFLFGYIVWALYLCVVILLANGNGFQERFFRLFNWDSYWYSSIVEFGYHTTIPPTPQKPDISNVAFFPGYPYTARVIHLIFEISSNRALLFASNFYGILFFSNFFFCSRALKFSFGQSLFCLAVILCFPTSFYLLSAYSESMFMAGIFGFAAAWIRYADSGKFGVLIYGALMGMLMTSSRITGLAVAFVPFVYESLIVANARFFRESQTKVSFLSKNLVLSLLFGGVASLGAAAFYAFCFGKWGHWNLYGWTQEIGWGIKTQPWFLFKHASWNRFFSAFLEFRQTGLVSSNAVSGIMTQIWILVSLVVSTVITRHLIQKRVVTCAVLLWGLSFSIFLISAVGLYHVRYQSMSRYLLPSFALFCPFILLVIRELKPNQFKLGRIHWLFITVVMALMILLQGILLKRVTAGGWVAEPAPQIELQRHGHNSVS